MISKAALGGFLAMIVKMSPYRGKLWKTIRRILIL